MVTVMIYTAYVVGVLLLAALGLLLWHAHTFNETVRARAKHRAIDVSTCRCGHPQFAHEHDGSDCVRCTCVSFRKARFRGQSVRPDALAWLNR